MPEAIGHDNDVIGDAPVVPEQYNVTKGTNYAPRVEVDGSAAVKFGSRYTHYAVKGSGFTVALTADGESGDDGVYDTDDFDDKVARISDVTDTDTLYLTGTGTAAVWGGFSADDCPFKSIGGGGDANASTSEFQDNSLSNTRQYGFKNSTRADSTSLYIYKRRYAVNAQYNDAVLPIDISGDGIPLDVQKDYEIGVAILLTKFTGTHTMFANNGEREREDAPWIRTDINEYYFEAPTPRITSSTSSVSFLKINDVELILNKWYFLKIVYKADTTSYWLYVTDDFVNWHCDKIESQRPYNTSLISTYGFGCDIGSEFNRYRNFIIDLDNTYMKQGDDIIWGKFTGEFGSEYVGSTYYPTEIVVSGSYKWGFSVTLRSATAITVDWGDGTVGTYTSSGNITHNYSSNTTRTVKISADGDIALYQSAYMDNLDGYSTRISVGSDVSYFGCFAKDITRITRVYFRNPDTILMEQTFMNNTNITMVALPQNLAEIPPQAFTSGNDIIASLSIPATVTSIGDSAFENCAALTKLQFYSEVPPTFGDSAFTNCNFTTILVPHGCGDAYKEALPAYADVIKEI